MFLCAYSLTQGIPNDNIMVYMGGRVKSEKDAFL